MMEYPNLILLVCFKSEGFIVWVNTPIWGLCILVGPFLTNNSLKGVQDNHNSYSLKLILPVIGSINAHKVLPKMNKEINSQEILHTV